MANSGYKNTNGSQFFIVTDIDIAEIDGQNVAFGKVYHGMDIVKSIESQRTVPIEGGGDKPIEDCVIADCGIWEEGMDKKGPEDGYPVFPSKLKFINIIRIKNIVFFIFNYSLINNLYYYNNYYYNISFYKKKKKKGFYEAENPNYLEIAQSIKQSGNNKFATGSYKSAVKLYKKVIYIIIS